MPQSLPDPVPVVRELQRLLVAGTPWLEGGRAPARGLDCYGLVHLGYQLAGVTLPPTPEEAERLFVLVEPPYRPFDVVLCRSFALMVPRHLGLLLAPEWGFHASSASNGLARFRLTDALWRRTVRHGLRYTGE